MPIVATVAHLSYCLALVGRSFVKRFALCYRTVVCPVLSVCNVGVLYCGQTVRPIQMKLGVQVGLGPGHIVLDGDPAPSTFRPMFIIVIVILLEHCTMHSGYWFVQVQVLVFYAFYF